MKHSKMLGLLTVAAAALMAFAGSASAATLTSPTGTHYTGAIEATSKHTQLDGTVNLTCTHSLVKANVTHPHHVKLSITNLAFSGCGTDTVEALKNAVGNYGELTIDSAGKVTSIGTRVTALTHRIVITIPVTTHCIYNTGGGTPIGLLDDSHDTGTNATFTIGPTSGGAPIPEEATDTSACKDDAVWTGEYTITNPNRLYVD